MTNPASTSGFRSRILAAHAVAELAWPPADACQRATRPDGRSSNRSAESWEVSGTASSGGVPATAASTGRSGPPTASPSVVTTDFVEQAGRHVVHEPADVLLVGDER